LAISVSKQFFDDLHRYYNRVNLNTRRSMHSSAVYTNGTGNRRREERNKNLNRLLEGKTAIITGGGSGVGRAACQIFARQGAKIVVADIDSLAAVSTADLLHAEGFEGISVKCDVADQASVQGLVARAVEAFGRLDIMFNNAGVTTQPGQGSRDFADAETGEINRLYGINVNGVIYGCQAAIRQFADQSGPGVIVNTSSVAGLIAYGNTIYGSTKGALTALTRALALEYAPQGVRVNAVCPAGMPTNFIAGGLGKSEAARASMAATYPLGRPIDPEDCANAALFLASDLAKNITGVNLAVDGGLSTGVPTRR
jgi:NAD(P)-dependent dehydrogenase (short-subunit alcohol dehydrogenase family)